jgi:hypothetical protein
VFLNLKAVIVLGSRVWEMDELHQIPTQQRGVRPGVVLFLIAEALAEEGFQIPFLVVVHTGRLTQSCSVSFVVG